MAMHRLLLLFVCILVVGASGESAPAECASSAGQERVPGLSLLQAKSTVSKPETTAQVLAQKVEQSTVSRQQEASALLRVWGSRVVQRLESLLRSQASLFTGTVPTAEPDELAGATQGGTGDASAAKSPKTGFLSQVPKISVKDLFWHEFIGGTVYILFICAFAYLYMRFKEAPSPELLEEQHETHGFQFGIVDTTKCSAWLCFLSCCCCPLRWADTVSQDKLKLIAFWPALVIITGLVGYGGLPYVGAVLTFGLLGMLIYFRQQIRGHYNIERNTCMTVLEDCLCYTLCAPCAVAQEARQVEHVEAK